MFLSPYPSGVVIAVTAAIHIELDERDNDVVLEEYLESMGQQILGITSQFTESISEAARLAEVSKDSLGHLLEHVLNNHIDDLRGTSVWEAAEDIDFEDTGWDPSLFEDTDLGDVLGNIDADYTEGL